MYNNSKIPTIIKFLYLNIININFNEVGCIWWKYHIEVLSVFRLNLFARNQLFNLNIVLLAESATDGAVLRAKNKLVSSANSLTFSFGTASAISLM